MLVPPMARFWILTLALVLTMLLLFVAVQLFDLPFLREDASYLLGQEKWVAALAGFGLLAIDVVAPVPSSIVMTVNGTLFGMLPGTALSLSGSLAAAIIAYWIGTKGKNAGERWMGREAVACAHTFFVNHGVVAVIVSRPIPILAEAIGIIAGVSRMPAKRFLWAAALGLLPTSLVYSIAGAYSKNLNTGIYAMGGVFVLAGLFWAIGKVTLGSRKGQ